MKTIVFIMGKSGCGKSTLERSLVTLFPDLFTKVVSSTTRPRRESEIDGRDYHFVTDEQFDNLDLVQYTEFADQRYGSSVQEYTTEHRYPILSVVPSSVVTFTPIIKKKFPTYNTYNIFFDISDERLKQNMSSRGDSAEYIDKRISQDDLKEQFLESGLTADFIVTDDLLNEGLFERVQLAIFKSNSLRWRT